MKAVADALGVARKALHRHVGDREQLLELVVMDSFETEIQRIELPDDADWQAMLRAHGQAIRDGVRNLGAIAARFRLSSLVEATMRSGEAGSIVLPWTEHILQGLVSAGFAVDDAGSILALVTSAALSNAYDTKAGVHNQSQVARALMTSDHHEFPMLGQMISRRNITSVEASFRFALHVIIAGLERHLSAMPIAE
jgi:TetR/AcrR family transcriptional regulator, tetracycline repressor protein